MFDGTHALIAATLAFVGGHFLLSSKPLRPFLVQRYGEQSFRILYSIAIAAAFLWMLAAYLNAPYQPVWEPAPLLAWVPLLVMPLAAILIVAGLTTPNPTLVGGERLLDGAPAQRRSAFSRSPVILSSGAPVSGRSAICWSTGT